VVLGGLFPLPASETAPPAAAPYEYRSPASPDGIGKFYYGREIAQVMSHAGAEWLERPEREVEEAPDRVVAALGLRPGQVVADFGAGTGYFTWRLARAVGPTGRVFAVDLQPEMLERLRENMAARAVTNYRPVLATEQDPRLPENSLDLVLLVDVYHELAWPHEVLAALGRALKPGGRLALVEYRAEDPAVPIKPLHKMSEAQILREVARPPLEWVTTVRSLPWQHLVIFRKREHPPEAARDPPGH
jgi:ubiquinone/menaquinone biosynthesis C-methylase UbiE